MKHLSILSCCLLIASISVAQNVGINDPAPTAKLTVKGTESAPDGQGAAIKIQNTAGTTNAWYLRAGGSGNNTPKGGFSIADNFGYHFNMSEGGNLGLGIQPSTAKLDVNGAVKIQGVNTLEFGAGVAGKETNAGRIGYQTFTPGALDIVGAGTLPSNRKINIFAEGGTTFNGQIKITGGVPAVGKVLTSDATGLASWQILPSTNSGFEVSTSASQIIPASMFTKVIFDTEYTDDAAAFNTATSELTITSTGFYHLNSALSFSASLPANTLVNLLIFRNGITIKYKSSRITGLSTIDLSADIKLTANDIITVHVIQTSSTPATINNGRDFTYLSGFKVY